MVVQSCNTDSTIILFKITALVHIYMNINTKNLEVDFSSICQFEAQISPRSNFEINDRTKWFGKVRERLGTDCK